MADEADLPTVTMMSENDEIPGQPTLRGARQQGPGALPGTNGPGPGRIGSAPTNPDAAELADGELRDAGPDAAGSDGSAVEQSGGSSSLVRKPFKLFAGWSLIVLGVVGFVLPILQGWLFVLLGLAVLSTEYHWARQLRCRIQKRLHIQRDSMDDGLCAEEDLEDAEDDGDDEDASRPGSS